MVRANYTCVVLKAGRRVGGEIRAKAKQTISQSVSKLFFCGFKSFENNGKNWARKYEYRLSRRASLEKHPNL